MKNIIFVSPCAPFPPRDGVTIPIAGLIRALSKHCSVSLHIVCEAGNAPNANDLIPSEKYCSEITVVKRVRAHPALAFIGEIILWRPFFHAWHYDKDAHLGNFDSCLIIASPINVLDYAFAIKSKDQPVIAAISDVYTSLLRSLPIIDTGIRGRISHLVKRYRGLWMGLLERRILSACSKIIVQTERDLEWVATIGGPRLRQRAVAIPNGVPDELIVSSDRSVVPEQKVLFIANFLSPYYRAILFKFVSEIWPKVLALTPNAELCVIGRGLNIDSKLMKLLTSEANIKVLGFVPKLCDVYVDIRVSVAPIFKSYGFINKVAESLAFSVPVVGDRSAFNGLVGAVECGAGWVADSDSDFVNLLASLLSDDSKWKESAKAAREFSNEHLSWSKREPLILDVVKEYLE